MRRLATTALLVLTRVAFADYAWFPDYQRLNLRGTFELVSSGANLLDDGSVSDLTVLSQPGTFRELAFYLEPEYGIAQDWSLWGRFGFTSGYIESVADGSAMLVGNGLTDSRIGLKWGIKDDYPLVTFDTYVKFPTGFARAQAADELVVGEGAVDLGLRLHTGIRSGPVLVALSPGFLARFGGYSPAVTLEAAIQVGFTRGYVRVTANGIYSLQALTFLDSSIDTHDAPGAGGTYHRLNGSPVGLSVGGRLGIQVTDKLTLEGGAAHTVLGMRYPYSLSVQLGAILSLDFFDPDDGPKIREVPFEGESPEAFPQD